MSIKEWFYQSDDFSVGGYQQIVFEDENDNDVVIQLEQPDSLHIVKEGKQLQVSVALMLTSLIS
jgi:hypothetical protein